MGIDVQIFGDRLEDGGIGRIETVDGLEVELTVGIGVAVVPSNEGIALGGNGMDPQLVLIVEVGVISGSLDLFLANIEFADKLTRSRIVPSEVRLIFGPGVDNVTILRILVLDIHVQSSGESSQLGGFGIHPVEGDIVDGGSKVGHIVVALGSDIPEEDQAVPLVVARRLVAKVNQTVGIAPAVLIIEVGQIANVERQTFGVDLVEVQIGILFLAGLDGDEGHGEFVKVDIAHLVVEAEFIETIVELDLGVGVGAVGSKVAASGAIVLGDIEALVAETGHGVADGPLVVAVADVEPIHSGIGLLESIGVVGEGLDFLLTLEDGGEGSVLGDGDVARSGTETIAPADEAVVVGRRLSDDVVGIFGCIAGGDTVIVGEADNTTGMLHESQHRHTETNDVGEAVPFGHGQEAAGNLDNDIVLVDILEGKFMDVNVSGIKIFVAIHDDDALEVGVAEESIAVDAGNTGGKDDSVDKIVVEEGELLDGGDTLGDNHLADGGIVDDEVARTSGGVGKGILEVDAEPVSKLAVEVGTGDGVATTEGILAETLDSAVDGDHAEVGITHEGLGADSGDGSRKIDEVEVAAVEGAVADGSHRGRQVDGLESRAVTEGLVGQSGQLVGEGDIAESGAAFEDIGAKGGDAGQIDSGQSRALGEGVVADAGDGGLEIDALEAGAAAEGIGGDGHDSVAGFMILGDDDGGDLVAIGLDDAGDNGAVLVVGKEVQGAFLAHRGKPDINGSIFGEGVGEFVVVLSTHELAIDNPTPELVIVGHEGGGSEGVGTTGIELASIVAGFDIGNRGEGVLADGDGDVAHLAEVGSDGGVGGNGDGRLILVDTDVASTIVNHPVVDGVALDGIGGQGCGSVVGNGGLVVGIEGDESSGDGTGVLGVDTVADGAVDSHVVEGSLEVGMVRDCEGGGNLRILVQASRGAGILPAQEAPTFSIVIGDGDGNLSTLIEVVLLSGIVGHSPISGGDGEGGIGGGRTGSEGETVFVDEVGHNLVVVVDRLHFKGVFGRLAGAVDNPVGEFHAVVGGSLSRDGFTRVEGAVLRRDGHRAAVAGSGVEGVGVDIVGGEVIVGSDMLNGEGIVVAGDARPTGEVVAGGLVNFNGDRSVVLDLELILGGEGTLGGIVADGDGHGEVVVFGTEDAVAGDVEGVVGTSTLDNLVIGEDAVAIQILVPGDELIARGDLGTDGDLAVIGRGSRAGGSTALVDGRHLAGKGLCGANKSGLIGTGFAEGRQVHNHGGVFRNKGFLVAID